MSATIARMVVEMTGDERPLRQSFQRARRDVEDFQATAARAIARPMRVEVDVGKDRALRDIREVEQALERAEAKRARRRERNLRNAGRPPGPPEPAISAYEMGLMGATGRWGGLDAAQITRMTGGGSGVVTDMFGFNSQLAARSGEKMAKDLIGGLRRTYRAEMADAREELFRGLINQQEFEARGRQAAAAMNRGILSGIERIGDSGKMTAGLHQKLVGELNMTGLAAGQAFTRATRRAMRSNAMYSAAITAGFGLEQIVRAKDNVERSAAGIRTALQATAAYAAAAFGPGGLIVGAVAIGTAAIVDHFATTRQEMRAMREEWEKEIKGMVNAGDQLALVNKLRLFDQGNPAEGMGKGGGFVGGFLDMAAQMQEAVNRVQAAKAALGGSSGISIMDAGGAMVEVRSPLRQAYDAAVAEMDRLRPQVETMVSQRNELIRRIMNPPTMPREATGLPAVTVTANTPAKQAEVDFAGLGERLAAVVANIQTVRETMRPIAGLSAAVSSVWDEITDRLARAGDNATLLATQLRGMKGELEKAIALPERIQTALRMISNVPQVTPNRPTVPTVPERLGTAPGDLPGLGGISVVKAQIATTFASIGGAIKDTLMASFGPLAALMAVLEPGIRALQPLFDAFVAPLAAVVEVVAVGLEPVFRLLFPIVKAVAWVFSFAYEIIARAVSGLARVVGNVIVAIGKGIDMLPFISGKGVIRAGESILKFADGVKQSADTMAETRKRLESMEFGDTARDVNRLGDAASFAADALSNVPEFFRLTLQQLRHFGLENVYGYAQPVGQAAGSGGGVNVNVAPGAIVIRGEQKDPRAVAREVVRTLETVATGFGATMPWGSVPSTAI